MIAQWDSSLSVLPVARIQFPAMAEYFKGCFPGRSHSTNLFWASVAENGSISPQWHHTACGQWGGRPMSNHGWMIMMAERKKGKNRSCPWWPSDYVHLSTGDKPGQVWLEALFSNQWYWSALNYPVLESMEASIRFHTAVEHRSLFRPTNPHSLSFLYCKTINLL